MAQKIRMAHDAFEEIYKTYFARIYNYIYYRVQNAHTAEDLAADTFVRAYEYWASYHPEKAPLDAWLGGIARNAVNTHYRKSAGRPQVIELAEYLPSRTDIEGELIHKEIVRHLLLEIRKLPDAHRDLLAMKYMMRLKNKEIAKLTGMSESNVGVTLHRVIGTLRKNLSQTV